MHSTVQEKTLLSVEELRVWHPVRKLLSVVGYIRAVDGVSFSVKQGEIFAIVGESGCGKSSLARALIRLLPRNIGLYKGSVFLENEDITKLEENEFRKKFCGKK